MDLDFLENVHKPCDIRHVQWPAKMTILVTAPHPDDFDAIGVTMRYFAEHGHDVHVVVCHTGSGIDRVYGAGMTKEDRNLLRMREQLGSLRFFGLDNKHYRFAQTENASDDQVDDVQANYDYFEALLNELKPDMLFMPHGHDTNRAHRAMCHMMTTLAQKMPWPIALMLNSDVKTTDMHKDFYMGFDGERAQWKARLLRYHDSQHQRNLRDRGHGFDERVLKLNQQTARQLGIEAPYAASFEVVLCR